MCVPQIAEYERTFSLVQLEADFRSHPAQCQRPATMELPAEQAETRHSQNLGLFA